MLPWVPTVRAHTYIHSTGQACCAVRLNITISFGIDWCCLPIFFDPFFESLGDENGNPWVLPSVRAAERILLDDPTQNKEYLPIDGDPAFVEAALTLAYGQEIVSHYLLAGIQTLSGTGALRMGGALLHKLWPDHPIYLPDPTWDNHGAIFHQAGLTVKRYRYYNQTSHALDLTGILHDLQQAPDGSIFLWHASAHNPTGCDPTTAEWELILAGLAKKQHPAFFDLAYQGLATGNTDQDAQPVRDAVRQMQQHRVPVILAQSLAKNFGLYGERVGTLSGACERACVRSPGVTCNSVWTHIVLPWKFIHEQWFVLTFMSATAFCRS